MAMSSSPNKLRECDSVTCTELAQYFCEICPVVLCSKCKDIHVRGLKTIDHKIVTYREKYNPKGEKCSRHSDSVYAMYCTFCELPICSHCTEHDNHSRVDIHEAYEMKHFQYEKSFDNISEVLFSRHYLTLKVIADIKRCLNKSSENHSKMLGKAQRVKNHLDNISSGLQIEHRCLRQIKQIISHIARIQTYEYTVEHSTTMKFLLYVKKLNCLPMKNVPHFVYNSNLSMSESNKKDLMTYLSWSYTRIGIPKMQIKYQLFLRSKCAKLRNSFAVKCVSICRHISFVTSDRFWVSDRGRNLTLTNTKGDILCGLTDVCSGDGFHAVNNENELFFIDAENDIKKLSKDLKTSTKFIQRTDVAWTFLCLYWSSLTEELLVGMHRELKDTLKVTRYSQTGQLTQTIQYSSKEIKLCHYPRYITENNNGDVVVSGPGAVVVTSRGGKQRFSYTGYPSGSDLWPRGICTDALSHILVGDKNTSTVQMIDEHGNFLKRLMILRSDILCPYSLRFDVETHRLWVGSWNINKICVFTFLSTEDVVASKYIRIAGSAVLKVI